MEIANIEPPSERDYIQMHFLAPVHPFRMLLCGPSGSGKTNVMINLIMKYLYYDRVYIYAKNYEDDPKWMFLKRFFERIANDMLLKTQKRFDKMKGKGLVDGCLNATADDFMIAEFHSNIDDVIPVDQLDPEKQNLVVFDDFINDKVAQPVIVDYFTRGRHSNCSVCYLSQSYFSTPKNVRLNCNYFALFKVSSRKEMQMIRNDHCADVDPEDFMKMFQSVGDHQFLLIDKKTDNDCLKYRICFDNVRRPTND